MSRVLITGGGGFIGRELVPLLVEAGHEVHLLGRSPADGATFHACDLLSDNVHPIIREVRPDSLIHLAWYAKPGLFWEAPENLDWVAASLALIRAFADFGGRRVVIAGTCAEYDWGFPRLEEATTPLRPSTLYGIAKASLFRLVEAAAPGLGLSLAWARIFFPYGAREQPGRLLSSLVDGIAAGQPVDFSAGLQSRDFMHVRDVARAILMLMESQVDGPVNIASGKTVEVREFIRIAASAAGGEQLVRLGARPMRPADPHHMAAAADRLRNEVGFKAQFDLERGLTDAVCSRLALVRPHDLG